MAGDAELAARHRAGDASAFGLLHARHAGRLRAHARRVVGPDGAEDVVQEAFERAHRLLLDDERTLRPDFAFGAWMAKVVHHRAIDELRSTRRTARVATPDVATLSLGPLECVVLVERLDEVSRVVRGLPDRQREALVGHALDGETHSEVAGRLGVSVAASKSLVNRARSQLRDRIAA